MLLLLLSTTTMSTLHDMHRPRIVHVYMVLETCTGHLQFTGPCRVQSTDYSSQFTVYSLQFTGFYRLLQTIVADSVYAMQIQRVQRHLLRMIHSDHPDLMYPAALGCLADLEEVIKLNKLLHGTDALPESYTFHAASSMTFEI